MFRTLIRTLSISALALMALTGFGAQAALTTSGGASSGTDATTTPDGTYQLSCAWYQRNCVRTPTAVAGVRG